MADDLDQFHPAIVAADSANMEAGADSSLLDKATMFTGSAVVSGLASIYNTGANLLGADKFDVAQYLNDADEHWGNFYKENKGAIDTTGFIATSLIPGGIAVKGLQLAKAGTFVGPFARALGYASSRQQFYVAQGLKDLAQEGGTVYNLINKNALASMAWGTADQMLSVAAFETGIALTMKQSPLMEKDEWADVAKHIALTSLAFGGAAGAIESIAMNSIFKGAVKSIDEAMSPYRTLRIFKGQDIPLGDQAYGLAASILELPTVGRNVEFTYRLAGKTNNLELPTKDVLERTVSSTEKRGWDDFRLTINQMASGDAELGQQYADAILAKVQKAKESGADAEELRAIFGDHLQSVGKITRVPADAAETKDLFYVAERVELEKIPQIKTTEDLLKVVRSRAPTGADQSSKPYQLVGNSADLKIGIAGLKTEAPGNFPKYTSVADGFEDGADVVVLANGTLRVNPKSKNFRHVDDPITTPRSYFNTRTGAFTDVAFPTMADLATPTKALAMPSPNLVVAGGHSRTLKVFDEFNIADPKTTTIETSARYVFAHETQVVPSKIADTDIPFLERINQDGAGQFKDRILRSADGTERSVGDISDFSVWLQAQKALMLQTTLANATKGLDTVELASKMNVTPQWIQTMVQEGFAPRKLEEGFSIPLKDSLRPQNLEVRWDFEKALATVPAKGVNKKLDNVLIQNLSSDGLPQSAGNIVYGHLGWSYRVKIARQGLVNAFTSVMGAETAARFVDLDPEVATKIADQLGAGAGLLKFSNADYGDVLRLWSQYSGQQVNIIGKNAANDTLKYLQAGMIAIKDNPKAGAELGVLTTALRRTPEKFMFDPKDGMKLVNVEAVVKGEVNELTLKELEAAGRRATFILENKEVAQFLEDHTLRNGNRIDRMKVLMTARGWNYNYDPRVIYAPSVDTARYPFFAFIRKNPETLGGSSEVSMITARTDKELRELTGRVPDGYTVQFKENTEKYFKIKGDYDYALTLKEPTIDATLQRRGVLGDFFPEVRPENVLDDYINWHQRAEVSLVRRAVETRYAQTFEELRAIGKQYEEVGSSKFGGILKKFRSQIENPFEDYLKTALDISKRGEYTLLHEANEFAESLGKSAYRIFGVNQEKAMSGTVSWQEANRISERFGIAGPYRDAETLFQANLPEEKNLVREFVGKANMFLVNLTLRLDLANSLVNIISTPILLGTEMASIRSLVANDSALAGKLNELRSIALPDGSGMRIPSTTGLLATAIRNFWGEDKALLLKRYQDLGAIQTVLSQYHQMVEKFAYKPYAKVSELAARGTAAVELGAKLSANEWAEQFTRFVSADVMRQLTDPIVAAGKLSVAEQNAYISVFVNRVQGNYLSSQRPVLFQGVLGSAVSLFQTYQFNLLQQLFRHIENRDTRAIATLGGLQAGIYGLNGIPFFEAVNTHLVGNSNLNPEHKDVYSTAPQLVGKQLGDWMMYGTASAFPLFGSKAPSLYTRGDINPRHISIIPISPLDVPAVDGSIRFVKNLVNMGKKAFGGADLSSTLLEGLEHNSLSRPLAGIAQVLEGASTTSKGSLIAASNDLNLLATASRIAGAKPLDESLALNSLFRLNAYQAADQSRIEQLGEAVKTKLRGNQIPTPEELHTFQLEYAKSGGRIENYTKTLQRWSKDANVSVVNQLAQQHRSSYSKRLQEIMGGTTLQDYRNQRLRSGSSIVASGGEAANTSDTQVSGSTDVSNSQVASETQ